MTTQQKSTMKLRLPSSVVSGSHSLVQPPHPQILNPRVLTPKEQHIQEELRADLAEQLGAGIKTDLAQQVAHTLTVRTQQRFDHYLTIDRSLRDKGRPPEDQADFVAFANRLREDFANDLLEIRDEGMVQVKAPLKRSLTPPEEEGEDIIIEEKPGWFGFGGQKITRVVPRRRR